MIIRRTKVVQMSGITKQNHKILFFYSRMQPTLLKGSANERNKRHFALIHLHLLYIYSTQVHIYRIYIDNDGIISN